MNTIDKNGNVLRFKGQRGERQEQDDDDTTKKEPPAVLIRKVNKKGVECRYNYVKTLYSNQELDDLRFEHQCIPFKRNLDNFIVLQLRCTLNSSRNCQFALLAWWPDKDRKRILVYAHGEHNHHLASAEERLEKKRSMWPDEAPPADFCTEDARYWTYVETSNTKVHRGNKQQLVSLLGQLKRQYRCYDKQIGKQNTLVRRATLPCTTTIGGFFGPSTDNCNFQLLIQRTNRSRYHIYASDEHTCEHRNTVSMKQPLAKGKPQGGEKKNDEEDHDDHEEEEVEVMEDEWEQKGAENEEEEELKWDEFEEEELLGQEEEDENADDDEEGGNVFDEILFGHSGRGILVHKQQEGGQKQQKPGAEWPMREEVVNMETAPEKGQQHQHNSSNSREQAEQGMLAANNNDEATMPTTTAAMKRTRNPSDNDEAEDGVQFVDFVDHPKFEVVKMRRLGEEKREPAIDAIITMNEEENGSPRAKAVQQKRMIGMPKRELVKEEKEVPAPDEEQQPPQHQQQEGANNNNGNGMAAAIQVPLFVRERWWAEPNRGRVDENVPNNGNEPRLLRERKRRVDYRNIDDLI